MKNRHAKLERGDKDVYSMREYNGSLRLRGSREADLEGYRVKSDNAGYSFHA